ncbi:Zinc finger, CCHC-type [Corchorus olitorius]|uniref:Zinc finger, CCHC-type n=1 Tax=Corchorus olitorius TaxID=93759 RepID=A0A1R3G091_9ROSI|nr:Zinc finger, CCHC-type [Corchorus olitorius]
MIVSSKSSQEAMSKLTNIFAGKIRSRVMSLKKKLTLSAQGTKSVANYIQSVRSTTDELALAQAPVSEEDQIIFILNGLNPVFREISTAIRARETAISMEELHYKLTDYEAVIKQDELTATPTIMAHLTTRGKGPQNRSYVQQRGNNFRGNSHHFHNNFSSYQKKRPNQFQSSFNNNKPTCQLCGKVGHIARTCRQFTISAASTPVANIVQSSNYVDAQNWVVGFAATNHKIRTFVFKNLEFYA